MKVRVREVTVKSALTKTGIPGRSYCVNPYVGCSHACRYCYATFMKKFTGHREPWGSFVDVRINAPDVLRKQLRRYDGGGIIMSSVTDPYQKIEEEYGITRACLEVFAEEGVAVDILTKSPLVTRDIALLSEIRDVQVGITITTENDGVRRVFEPFAPPIHERVAALRKLNEAGIGTYVFIGPVLPMNPEALAREIGHSASHILIDSMNYPYKVRKLYARYHCENWLNEGLIRQIMTRLRDCLSGREVDLI